MVDCSLSEMRDHVIKNLKYTGNSQYLSSSNAIKKWKISELNYIIVYLNVFIRKQPDFNMKGTEKKYPKFNISLAVMHSFSRVRQCHHFGQKMPKLVRTQN